jgi:AAA15 family ATPase/GTPase
MSIINDIEIKNFKSIRHQKIEGCKRINVFVGPPNVGKSNILEGLGLYSIDSNSKKISDFVRMGKGTTLFFNGSIETPVQIILNENCRIKVTYQSGGILSASIEYDRYDGGFDNIDDEIKKAVFDNISEAERNLISKAIFSVKEDAKEILNCKASSEILIYNKNNDDKLNQKYLSRNNIKKYDFRKNIEYNSNDASSLRHPFGENIFEIISTKKELHKSIIDLLNKYGLNFLYDSEIQEYKILNLLGDKFFTVPYFMIADTLQRLIFHKAAIASNKNSVLLFEEPEANMYPPYISKFTSDMMYDDNGNQFFIATHSPYVINDIMENLKKDDYAIYTVGYDKENGETLIRRMTDEELHEIYQYGVDLFLNLENFLPHAQQQ